MGHAVSFIAAASPKLMPAVLIDRRCKAATPSSISARIGMSSPPVERNSAPVGNASSTWAIRIFFPGDARNNTIAAALTNKVISDMMMRASVRPELACVSADGRPKTLMSGKYGKNDS